MTKSITPARVARILGLPRSLVVELEDHFKQLVTTYRRPTRAERDEYLLLFLEFMKSPGTARGQDENRNVWTRGWQEHLDAVLNSEVTAATLKPKYFRDCQFLRWQKDVIVSENLQLEHDLFTVARILLFYAHLRAYSTIYEIGCGSGQNLLMLATLFPDKEIVGLDWVEPAVRIADTLGSTLNKKISGRLFNMLDPPRSIHLSPNSAVITIHAMEQIGNNHEPLLDYLLAERPALVLNYEPILEFYDSSNLLDFLALWYSERRDYLRGYLTALRSLELERKVKILQAHRPGLGGIYHEASLLIWKPISETAAGTQNHDS